MGGCIFGAIISRMEKCISSQAHSVIAIIEKLDNCLTSLGWLRGRKGLEVTLPPRSAPINNYLGSLN